MTNKEFKTILLDKHISIKEVAFELCVTERAVYFWVNNKRDIPLSI